MIAYEPEDFHYTENDDELSSSRNETVEPLPESSRPRKDGPGGD